jgi:hypothetical protein
MKTVDLTIKIDSNSRRIEFCALEDKDLNPKRHFAFRKGQWQGDFKNFKLNSDDDLDILIIVTGNPNSNSIMTVIIDGVESGQFDLFKPFNRNGYGQFNEEIRV